MTYETYRRALAVQRALAEATSRPETVALLHVARNTTEPTTPTADEAAALAAVDRVFAQTRSDPTHGATQYGNVPPRGVSHTRIGSLVFWR